MAQNKKKLSKKEFHGWAEYFSYEFDQHSKIELYLARMLDVLHGLAGAEIPFGKCFIPELDPELVEQAQLECRKRNMLSAEEMAAELKGAFGNGK